MCGISGIIGPDWQASQLEAMVEAQHHRGPDARGYFVEENVAGLGHNRLSIIDLSEAGNQPMHSADGQLVMVFNGEVYNYLELKAQLEHRYVFRTQTDSEVVLAAYQEWGAACLDKFIGMFSFAIWHRKEKKLFAARDRFGVKPFHYSVNTGRFYFASEIKALWAAGLPKRPNEPVWASYLTYGTYGMPNETFWVGVHQLPGGHFLEWKGDKITTVRWYDFENRLPSLPELSEQDAADQWLALARESIRLRFRADVPVGFNLSGGLDSSLLLGLVHQAYANNSGIKAFHFYTGDERYDELPWVRDMIAQTSFPLQTVRLEVEQVPQLAQQVAIHQDEPYGGIPTLAYSLIFQEARKKGTLVLLDGQGVDEALAGYDYYRQIGNNSIVQGVTSSPVRPDCLRPAFRALAQKPGYPTPFDNRLHNLQYRDLFYTKIPRALRFNDRVSMMHSTELREPFLDHRLVEFCFALPEEYKVKNNQGKWLARRAAASLLPQKVALAPKRPLQTPQREWMQKELSQWIDKRIEKLEDSPLGRWFDINAVQETYNLYKKKGDDNSFYVWQWVNLSSLNTHNPKAF